MRQILFSDYYQDFYTDENDLVEKKTRRRVFTITLCIVAALLVPGLFYLTLQVQYTRLNYKLNTLKETERVLENENRFLQAKKNQLNSLERIETIAREKLGMVPSGQPVDFIFE